VAQHGNVVILARSGFEILENLPMFSMCDSRRPARCGSNADGRTELPFEQRKSCEKNDKVHIAFAENYYKIPWDAVHAFDLVINTGKISPTWQQPGWLTQSTAECGSGPADLRPVPWKSTLLYKRRLPKPLTVAWHIR